MALLILTLYLNIGRKSEPENLINLSAVLFMWCCLPAFGAASYVPSIVIGAQLGAGGLGRVRGLGGLGVGPAAGRQPAGLPAAAALPVPLICLACGAAGLPECLRRLGQLRAARPTAGPCSGPAAQSAACLCARGTTASTAPPPTWCA